MNKLFLVALLVSLIGCTTASPKQYYRPAGEAGQLEISGRFNQLSFEHQVLINGDTVIVGALPYNYDPASFNGTYEEMEITSDCQWKSKTDLFCLVKVNDEMAATLGF